MPMSRNTTSGSERSHFRDRFVRRRTAHVHLVAEQSAASSPGCRRHRALSSTTSTRQRCRAGGGRAGAASARRPRGRIARAAAGATMNSLPWPRPALSPRTLPPCISTSRARPASGRCRGRRARVRPSVSTCANSSNISRAAARGQADAVVAHARPRRCRRRAARLDLDRAAVGSEYLAALLSRLANTCDRRVRRRRAAAAVASGSVDLQRMRAGVRAAGDAVSIARAAGRLQRVGSWRSSSLPRLMRETSSRSSTRRTSWRSCRSITSCSGVRRLAGRAGGC